MRRLEHVVARALEGYPCPTNLNLDNNLGG